MRLLIFNSVYHPLECSSASVRSIRRVVHPMVSALEQGEVWFGFEAGLRPIFGTGLYCPLAAGVLKYLKACEWQLVIS